jgi:hypothetical protein
MSIVIESPRIGEAGIERLFSAMSERRMAEVVSQAQCLCQVLVQPQRAGHSTADLGYLDGMGEADPKMIPVRRNEDLSFVPESAESDRMDDTVPVALKCVAGTARAPVVLIEGPPARS